jgi:hypothetical protein
MARRSTIGLLTLPLLVGCPSAKDHDEATAVLKHVQTNFLFREATTGQSIYFRPGVWRTDLNVYGVRSASDQDKIVALVRQARAKTSSKPVHVIFFDKRGNKRSEQTVLRKVAVDE